MLTTTLLVIIDDTCINCDMCVPECPTEAIHPGMHHYEINQDICIQCKGYYRSPTCIEVCPLGSVAFNN